MTKKILEEQRRLYSANFSEFGDSPEGTFQNNRKTQFLRYEKLMSGFQPYHGHFSIHDVGCGVADLHGYLLSQGVAHEYSGTEIVSQMIEVALDKYPDIRIFNRDLLNEEVPDRYDFVVLSGVFNLHGGVCAKDWKQFCFSMASKMFSLCKYGIAFNFLTSHNTFSTKGLAYFSPSEIFDFCTSELSRFTVLNHGYALYEATSTVLTKDFMMHRYRDSVFSRYFSG